MYRLLLILVCTVVAVPAFGQQQPTEAEMAFIYELNRARSDPATLRSGTQSGRTLEWGCCTASTCTEPESGPVSAIPFIGNGYKRLFQPPEPGYRRLA